MSRAIITFIFLALYAIPAAAEDMDAAGLIYELDSPTENASDALPMLVALHYMGGSPQTSRGDYAGITVPARILLLRGPYALERGFSWFPDGYYQLDADEQARITFEIADRLARFLDVVTKRYKTIGLPVVTGYSQGADLSHVLALHHGDKVGAILPMGARFEPEWITGASPDASFPAKVVLFHGEMDTTVPIKHSHKALDFYRAHSVPVTLEAFANAAHSYPANMKQRYEEVANEILGQ